MTVLRQDMSHTTMILQDLEALKTRVWANTTLVLLALSALCAGHKYCRETGTSKHPQVFFFIWQAQKFKSDIKDWP